MNMPVKLLIQDCPTRRNSSCYMLEWLLELRWPVSAVLSGDSVTKKSDQALDLKSTQCSHLPKIYCHPSKRFKLLLCISVWRKGLFVNSYTGCVGNSENLHPDTDDSLSVQSFK